MLRRLTTIPAVAKASQLCTCLRSDTLLKIQPRFWPSFGIHLDPGQPAVKTAAIEGYRVEWEKTVQKHHDSVAEGARRSGLGGSNAHMNQEMADLIVGFPLHRELNILDVGCGPGGSVLALAGVINAIVAACKVHVESVTLIDPSSMVERAASAVRALGVGKVRPIKGLVESKLGGLDLSKTNVVLFGASLHHMNLSMVLSTLRDKLPSGALIGVAEWCHPMLSNPSCLRVLMAVLDSTIEPGVLERFDSTFPTTPGERLGAITSLTPQTYSALLSVAGFWPNHADSCRVASIAPMFSFYEGHQTVRHWYMDFNHFGFEVLCYKSLNPDNEVNTVFVLRKP